jgi:tetratricopeptide (TPR) repeat protein
LGIPLAAGWAMLYMTARVPSYAQTKAFYVLVALVPLCALAATGAGLIAGRGRWLRILILTGLGTWAVTSYATYWIDHDGAQALTTRALAAMAGGRPEKAESMLREAEESGTGDWNSRLLLVELIRHREGSRPEVERLLRLPGDEPDLARRHRAAGEMYLRHGEAERAMHHLRRAMELDPDSPQPHLAVAWLLNRQGDTDGATNAYRDALAVAPDDPAAREGLARMMARGKNQAL